MRYFLDISPPAGVKYSCPATSNAHLSTILKMHLSQLSRKASPLLLTIALTAISGCKTTNHKIDAVLKGKNLETDTQYVRAGEGEIPYSSNAIFVPMNARYWIEFDKINPAWIHQNKTYKLDPETFEGKTITKDGKQVQLELTNEQSRGLYDKSLWVVYQITTKDAADPLEFSSKKSFKSSIVKYGSSSFGVIPLDTDESRILLESTTINEVKVTVHEVKNVALKRILISAARDNPGLSAMIRDAGLTMGSTFKSVVGDPLIQLAKKEYGEDLAVERLALTMGAVKQFEGTFTVLREKTEAVVPGKAFYALEDPYKKYPTTTSNSTLNYTNSGEYLNRIQASNNSTLTPTDSNAYVTFNVAWVKRPEVKGKATPEELLAANSALEKAKADLEYTEKAITSLTDKRKAASDKISKLTADPSTPLTPAQVEEKKRLDEEIQQINKLLPKLEERKIAAEHTITINKLVIEALSPPTTEGLVGTRQIDNTPSEDVAEKMNGAPIF